MSFFITQNGGHHSLLNVYYNIAERSVRFDGSISLINILILFGKRNEFQLFHLKR